MLLHHPHCLSSHGQTSIEVATVWPIGHFTETLRAEVGASLRRGVAAGSTFVVFVPQRGRSYTRAEQPPPSTVLRNLDLAGLEAVQMPNVHLCQYPALPWGYRAGKHRAVTACGANVTDESETDMTLGDASIAEAPDDARRALTYLVVPESDEYIAIMAVLESSPSDLTPAEVATALRDHGTDLDSRLVEIRLEKLREWAVVSARSDQTHVRRVQDLLRRNYRYTATRHGRQVQRFYETVLADTTVMREIPLQSLNAVVAALELLASSDETADREWIRARVNEVFIAHDNLDASLVGAEDTLMGLADRFDLDDAHTAELKSLLVNYARRVAIELDRGADRAAIALRGLAGRFIELARITVDGSAASDLIGRDLLAASKGGDERDWHGLVAWFDPMMGRSARFQSRMVMAIPTFHANLRRLHTAGESGTSRARALLLARACLDQQYGPQLFLAALGDHSWRKLHGEADDPGAGRTPPWRDGPKVVVPDGLRTHGRAGVRGRAPAPIDDGPARAAVARQRELRLAQHQQHLREILRAAPGSLLSDGAARVAFAVLRAALRQTPTEGRRRGTKDGLACSVFWTQTTTGVLRAPAWRVWLPGREFVFHAPAEQPSHPGVLTTDPGGRAELRIEGVVA